MLRAIDNYARGVFQPDDMRILVAAFDDAWRSLLASGVTFESDRESEAVRDGLAKHIIEQARYGERDQRRLRWRSAAVRPVKFEEQTADSRQREERLTDGMMKLRSVKTGGSSDTGGRPSIERKVRLTHSATSLPSTWVTCSATAVQPALCRLFDNLDRMMVAHPHVPN